VKIVSTDKRKEAVIVQNLGAVYNSLAQYEEALNHHNTAAAMHGEYGSLFMICDKTFLAFIYIQSTSQ
jgi:hypothetical protein